MSRHRRHHPVALIVLGTALLLAADIAAWAVWAIWHVLSALAPVLLLAGAGWAGWRLWRRRSTRLRAVQGPRVRVVQGTVASGDPEVARLRAERDDLRRQVAKLEDDAARHDQLVGDLEDAAGRPIEVVIETYRHVQRQYGPAAVGKRGGNTSWPAE